jgi:phosphoglycerate kinase
MKTVNLNKKTVSDIPDTAYNGKRVLVRTDFNVPLTADGEVASDYRIRESLSTLDYLLKRNARVIVVTHLGRPKGEPDPKYTLKPVAQKLREMMPNINVKFIGSAVGPEVLAAVEQLQPGEILMLENIRFEPGESRNDPALAKQLATITDIYVNDAFGAAHRAHASTEGVAHEVAVKVAGLLMWQELSALGIVVKSPEKPFTAIVGGSKVSTKIGVLSTLLKHVNNLVIGGGMVFTFLKAKGYNVGNSLVEDEHLETALNLMKEAEQEDRVIVLPKDVVIADRFAADAEHKIVPISQIPDGWMGLDLGPESTERIADVLRNSKTVFWNGPLGVFEFPAFATATREVAETIAKLTKEGQLSSVLGGGDTQAALEAFHITPDSFTHVSTGGGATLELMEGKELPGIQVLDDKVPTTSGV